MKIEKWKEGWEACNESGDWSVILLKKYWAACHAVFNCVPVHLAMLFRDASDMLSTRPPADMSFETGLERLAETCENIIKAEPADIEMAAGMRVMSTTQTKDNLLKYIRRLEDGRIGGLVFLARNLYLDPEKTGNGIGEVVRWYKDRVISILKKIKELEKKANAEIKEREQEERERIKGLIFRFSEKLLPRLSTSKWHAASNVSGPGWTDGRIADLVKIPDTIKCSDGRTADFNILWKRFLNDETLSKTVEITPVAIDRTLIEPLVLFADNRGQTYAAKAAYVKYFLRHYGEVQVRVAHDAITDPSQPIIIYKDGKPVGIIARFIKVLSDVEQEVLSEIMA